MPTLRDVARVCGLSAMTVSDVLNNKAGSASAQTRERVLKAAREMGYRPNAVARGLSRRRMNTLGVVMAYGRAASLTGDRYMGPILDSILDENRRRGQRTLVMTRTAWGETESSLADYFDGMCDGLILLIPTLSDDVLIAAQQWGVPFVIVGETRCHPALASVDVDNVQAAYAATQYLIAQGHRRIALFRGSPEFAATPQREQGYRQAMHASGLNIPPDYVLPGFNETPSGKENGQRIVALAPFLRPTALVCHDDWVAIGAMQALEAAGLRVPADVALIGINDDPEATQCRPPLTTMQQPFAALGAQAVDLLLALVEGRGEAGEKRLLPTTLVVRHSVAPPAHVSEDSVAVPPRKGD